MSRWVVVPVSSPNNHAFLPQIPAGGLHFDEEIARLPGARKIEGQQVVMGPSPDVHAFYRGVVQRNLYRIPIP